MKNLFTLLIILLSLNLNAQTTHDREVELNQVNEQTSVTTSSQILTRDTGDSNKMKYVPLSTLQANIITPVTTGANGLTLNGTVLELGGGLTKNTAIGLGSSTLGFNSLSSVNYVLLNGATGLNQFHGSTQTFTGATTNLNSTNTNVNGTFAITGTGTLNGSNILTSASVTTPTFQSVTTEGSTSTNGVSFINVNNDAVTIQQTTSGTSSLFFDGGQDYRFKLFTTAVLGTVQSDFTLEVVDGATTVVPQQWNASGNRMNLPLNIVSSAGTSLSLANSTVPANSSRANFIVPQTNGNRNYTFPDKNITFAGLDDVANISEWATSTGTRAGGDLVTTLGDYDDTNNSTKLIIDEEEAEVIIDVQGAFIVRNSSAFLNGGAAIENTNPAIVFNDTSPSAGSAAIRAPIDPTTASEHRLQDESGTLAHLSDVVQVTQGITYSAAQVIAGTEVELIPAQGVGKFVQIMAVSIEYDHNTVSFNSSGSLGIRQGSTSMFTTGVLTLFNSDLGYQVPQTNFFYTKNSAVTIDVDGTLPTQGDGNFTVYVTYKVIDTN